MKDRNLDSIKQSFSQRLADELAGRKPVTDGTDISTRDYQTFKKKYLPKHFTIYEKLCAFAEKNLPFTPDKNKIPAMQDAIRACHLNVTPTGVYSASFLVPITLIVIAAISFFIIPILLGSTGNVFFVMFALMLGVMLLIPLQQIPFTLANRWRLKASNQMVLAIFYIVTYMRHTSNLELAINFASEHLAPPLSLDLRKVVWDVEIQHFDNIKDSLNFYLESWREYNLEFIESVNLVESSLFENSNDRRLTLLDKSLEVMLTETYNKMLRYAHNLKGPLTTLNMLGVVLPILTLVILPLVVSFMDGFRWYHLFAMYNILLPAVVFYIGQTILSTRPGGSGNEDILRKNPRLKAFQEVKIALGKQTVLSFKPLAFSVFVVMIFFLIGFTPLIWNATGQSDFGFHREGTGNFLGTGLTFDNLDVVQDPNNIVFSFLGYRERDPSVPGDLVGPFGLFSLLLSVAIPVGLGLGIGLYYQLKTKKLIKIRNDSKALELEFASALFQLANRIGDGLPAEIAFGKVSQMMKESKSGKFFALVHINITRLGMSVEKAIFDKEHGAMRYYPSDIIESSMKVLVEASRKGPLVASQALGNVADYIQRIHSVDERLNDLMGDVISSMKSQVRFLTPVISGVVVGITSLITNIIGTLTTRVSTFADQSQGVGGSSILNMFGVGIPTYHFQIVVGLYVVQLALILSIISNGVENGPDTIGEEYSIGSNLTKSVVLYGIIAFILIIVFNVVAGQMIQAN
jgi:hypothetical protein